MNARTAALLFALSAVAGCSWLPFGGSQRDEPQPTQTSAPLQPAGDPAPQSSSSETVTPTRGIWPTMPVPPITGNEVDTGRRKAACTTAQRLRNDC